MSSTNIYYVYLHIRNDNNEVFYVGKGKNHRAKSRVGRSEWWKRIVDKYGYTIEYIEKDLSEDDALDLEVELIKFYRECGYSLCNLTDGGDGTSGLRHTDATKEKIRQAATGRKQSEETRRKVNAAQKGLKRSEEFCKHLSLVKTGKKVSEETKSKWKATYENTLKTRPRKKNPPVDYEGKSVAAFDIEKEVEPFPSPKGTKNTVEHRRNLSNAQKIPVKCSNGLVFASAKDAAMWLREMGYIKAIPAGITSCCRKKNKTAYGFIWEYLNKKVEHD